MLYAVSDVWRFDKEQKLSYSVNQQSEILSTGRRISFM
jgi:hypothetical protein